jgi:hypothetical protein
VALEQRGMNSSKRMKNTMIAAHMVEARRREAAEMRQAGFRRQMRPAWRAIDAHVSAVPDAAYPVDWNIIRAIHEFDPNVMPLMVTKVYQAQTGEIRKYRFHAIASRRWNPDGAPAEWTRKVLTPTHIFMPQPTHMDMHLEDLTKKPGKGLPGAYLPFGWGVYYGLREMYQEWTVAEKLQYMEEHGEEARARKEREWVEKDRETEVRNNKRAQQHLRNIDKRDIENRVAKLLEAQKPAPRIVVPG